MARGHWLDPLARSLLQATGQLPPKPVSTAAAAGRAPAGRDGAANGGDRSEHDLLERELLALKLRQNPEHRLADADEVRHAAALGWRLDVNRATAADWQRLPGISADQISLLLRLQRGGVQLSGPEDLQRLLELPSAVVASWQPLLLFRWYGDGPAGAPRPLPIDLNRAPAIELEQRLPQLSPERRQRLLRERRRSPFQDLGDLQERLQLPPALIEELIGRVRFGQGPAGPELPRSA
jgi:DNA uptake protein ComE-like DNA-binding protein